MLSTTSQEKSASLPPEYQAAMLRQLAAWGVDVKPAEGLSGRDLDRWIDEAEAAEWQRTVAEVWGVQ